MSSSAPALPLPGLRLAEPSTDGERPIDLLTDAELLGAILARDGLTLPAWLGGAAGIVNLSEPQLRETLALTSRQARRLAAALELHRRILRAQAPRRPQLQTPEQVAELFTAHRLLDHERLWCLPLDVRCGLIGDPIEVTRGDSDGTDAGPRAFLRAALRAGGLSCIAVHNHPAGNPTPSAADLAVTARLVAAGRAIDMPVVDHVIIGAGGTSNSLRRSQPGLWL